MHRVFLALVLLTGLAFANAGKPTWGGQRTGEPQGIVGVAIEREELVIDMRGVEYGNRAGVTATYHLANRGETRTLDLVFASGTGSLGDFRVTLDGAPVAAALRHDTPDLPDSWRAPHSTPDPDGGTVSFDVDDRGAGTAGFQLVVPPGAHVLAIKYSASALVHHAGRPVLLHQFAYVLAPARTWAGFGKLDVTVHVPHDWIAATSPELARTGDTLSGTFPNVPADSIGITIHAPTGSYLVIRIAGIVGVFLAIFLGGYLVHRLAFLRERRRARQNTLPAPGFAAFGLATLWAALVIAAGMFAITGPELALFPGQVDHRGFGSGLAMVGVVLLGMILFVAGLVVGIRSGRSAHPS